MYFLTHLPQCCLSFKYLFQNLNPHLQCSRFNFIQLVEIAIDHTLFRQAILCTCRQNHTLWNLFASSSFIICLQKRKLCNNSNKKYLCLWTYIYANLTLTEDLQPALTNDIISIASKLLNKDTSTEKWYHKCLLK